MPMTTERALEIAELCRRSREGSVPLATSQQKGEALTVLADAYLTAMECLQGVRMHIHDQERGIDQIWSLVGHNIDYLLTQPADPRAAELIWRG